MNSGDGSQYLVPLRRREVYLAATSSTDCQYRLAAMTFWTMTGTYLYLHALRT